MDSVSTKLQAKFQAPGYEKAAMDSRTLQRKNPTSGSLCGRNQNRCVVYLANPCMVAESVDRRSQSWFFRTDVESDMIVQVGESIFHLHKLPMVSRSAYLNRLVFERKRSHLSPNIQIENLPGGTKIFELVAKFCYGWKVDLTAKNIAPLYCAAHFLEMSDDLEEGNLVSQTESFLNFLILSSWKDTFRIFKSCESISSWARELHILKRCSEAVAWRACANHKNKAECLSALPDRANNRSSENAVDGWWFEDVVFLRIDHFIEVIGSFRKKGMKPKLVGSYIAHWTAKWLSKIKFGVETANTEEMTLQLQKVNVESLIRILPVEEGSVSIKVLLHLLKIGLVMKIGPELLNNLEERIVSLLENICAKDLLVKNYKPGAAAYDVAVVAKVLESYLLFASSNPASRISVIGRLLDEYLTLVARDENLPPQSFQLLVEALPRNARYCDDNLYRAIDMYLKAHPGVAEEERCSICRGMEYKKLSQEARKHAMKNDRLPVNIITRFILLEQIYMTRWITAAGSKYRRTKSQAIMRIGKGAGKGGMMGCQKEIKTMKQDVERIKVQISDLQQHRVDLQRQVRRQKFGFVRSSLMC